MDGLLTKILANYELDYKNIKKTKGYYIVNTADKTYALRKTGDSADHIEFRCAVQKKLLNNGFFNLEKIYPAREGSLFVLHEEQKYILTDYISGEGAGFEDREELSEILRCLADFHHKSKGAGRVAERFYAAHMGERLKRMAKELSIFRKKINFSKTLSDFDLIFLKNYEYYERNINTAIEILAKTDYNEKLKEALLQNAVCHNLLKKETIVIKESAVFLTSLSDCIRDHFTSDIAMIIARYLKYDIKGSIAAMEIINMYSDFGHTRLDRNDYRIILARLLMPSGFLSVLEQYYKKKRTWAPSALTGDLEYEIKSQKDFWGYIEPLFSICCS